jgi:hypothetical protein
MMTKPELPEGAKAYLSLQRATEAVFRLFYNHAPMLIRQEFTMVGTDPGSGGHVAFKSSLPLARLTPTFERLQQALVSGPPMFPPANVTASQMSDLARAVKKALPVGLGYLLVVGSEDRMGYASSATREDIVALLETELLPLWRKELADK